MTLRGLLIAPKLKLCQNSAKMVTQICIFDSCVSIFDWRSEHGRTSTVYHDSRKFLFVYHCESDMLLYTFEHCDNRSIATFVRLAVKGS